MHRWVVEDNFPNGRPPWEDVGALMVTGEAGVEVATGTHTVLHCLGYPLRSSRTERTMMCVCVLQVYEAMKLRMLNASHSAMAYAEAF